MDMLEGMPAREQYRKEEIGKENQLQEIKERRSGFKVTVVPMVIGAFGGGINVILKELENMFKKDDLCEGIMIAMQKTILMGCEIIIQKVLSGLAQSD